MYYGTRIPLEDVKLGMDVEFVRGGQRAFDPSSDYSRDTEEGVVGTVVGFGVDPVDGSKIVFLKLPEPTPLLLIDSRIYSVELSESFFPDDEAKVLGYGTLDVMKRNGIEIPSGRFVDDEKWKVYLLDEPLPISYVEGFCNKHYPDEPLCVMQSAFLDVLPLHPESGYREMPLHLEPRFRKIRFQQEFIGGFFRAI